MIRHSFIITLAIALLCGAGVQTAQAADAAQAGEIAEEAQAAIVIAEAEVEKARLAIERGKEFLAQIPDDSPLMPDVAQIIEAAAANWQIAVDSLKGAKDSSARIAAASNASIATDYALLTKVNASVALSGAKVVQIALSYIEAIATNRTESLDIIRTAMQDALASCSQVQFNYERVKTLIAQKYSK